METPTSASGDQKCQRRHLGGKKKRGPQKEQDSLTGSGGSSAWGSGSQGWAWDEVICQLSGPQNASLFPRSLFPSRVPALIPFPLGALTSPAPSPGPESFRVGGKRAEDGRGPVSGLPEGGAFPYLRAPASPLVCSAIASLAPAQCEEEAACGHYLPSPRQDLAMAGLLGTSLCGALLGFLCKSGEEGAGRDGESWGTEAWPPGSGAGGRPGRRRRRPGLGGCTGPPGRV